MSRPIVLAVLLSALLAVAADLRAAQLVVIESTASVLPPGTVVDGSTPLTLPAGSRVTLVGEDGATLRLQGPYSGTPAPSATVAADDGVVDAVSRLFAASQPTATSWGTFRGNETREGGQASDPPDPWAVNILRSESVCVPTGVAPSLWRPDASREVGIVLLHLSTGNEAELILPVGEQTVAWPAEVPLLDGGEYAVRDAGNRWERRLFVSLVPADRGTDVRRVAWMSDAGCLRQAKALLSSLNGGAP